ncbi:MAG: sugar ABC transporter permease [Firmicutes bacterium]|nr:sugar ABC transporter permease [Bacillota bacterium]
MAEEKLLFRKNPAWTRTPTRTRTLGMGILFVLPAIIVFLLFKYYPMFKALRMSLYEYSIMNPPGKFLGLGNYARALNMNMFWVAWKNNIVFFVLGILFGFWPPIIQAFLLDEVKRFQAFWRLLFLIPSAVPGMSGYILWKWIYHPDYGLLNSILGTVGLGPFGWLNDPRIAKIALTMPGLLGGGLGILIYLSAIQNIPSEHIEAASVDGATVWQKLRYIALPEIRPIVAIQLTLALTGAFQIFDQVFVMTGGGPLDSTRVITLLVYRYGFENYELGFAAALAMLMFVAVFIVTAIRIHYSRSDVA